jgi:hypothetical protein
MVLFKNLRDQSQVLHLSRQFYTGETKFFQEVLKLETEEKNGHLIQQKNKNQIIKI